MRILIAGIGNLLRGDDGFGVAVAQALRGRGVLGKEVRIIEAGIAGIGLVQDLMDGVDVLIIADAMDRDKEPGTVYLIEPQLTALQNPDPMNLHQSLVDAHYADPSKVLLLAQALNVLPRKVFLVGCQPEVYDEPRIGLSPSVEQALQLAVQQIENLVAKLLKESFEDNAN